MDNPNIQLEFEQLCKSSMSVTFPKHDDILKEALTIEKSNPPIQKFKQVSHVRFSLKVFMLMCFIFIVE